MKKLSAIIPVYNTPKSLLEHCLASVQENICNMGDEVEVLLINYDRHCPLSPLPFQPDLLQS